MAGTADPAGKWELNQVARVEMWEDPCPLWDNDGSTYLVRSKVCGQLLIVHRMSPDGKKLLDNGTVIYHDPAVLPVLEGPKFLKKERLVLYPGVCGWCSHGMADCTPIEKRLQPV